MFAGVRGCERERLGGGGRCADMRMCKYADEKLLNKETPLLSQGGLTLRLGTDLLSHILLQYHRLWRA
jgi:hypothetical protein